MRCLACTTLALALLIAPPALKAADLPALLDAAEQANGEGRAREAADAYMKAIDQGSALQDAQWDEALRGLLASASALAGQKQFTPAIAALTVLLGATRSRPLDAAFSSQVRQVFDQLAFELVLIHKGALAIQAITALMADDPGQPMRWAILARAHLEQGELEQATRVVKRGLKLHPDSPELLFVRASISGAISEVAVAQANYARAESMLRHSASDLERAAAREPRAAGILRALGRIRSSLWTYYRATGQADQARGMLEQAEAAYSRAAQLNPNNPDVPFDLARLMFTAQDWVWAESQFETALHRYRTMAEDIQISPRLRKSASGRMDACREGIYACRQARAVRMARRGFYDRAQALMARTERELPAYSDRVAGFRQALAKAQKRWRERIDDLSAQTGSFRAQQQLGDLWTQVQQFDRAEAAYTRALAAAPDEETRNEIRDLLYGTQKTSGTSLSSRMSIGELTVLIEAPADLDPARLGAALTKAHALTMGVFPQRLRGPVHLKVFANRRQFLEQAGLDLGPHQQGLYAFGRLMTYEAPHRPRSQWLEILVHELSHRYVDEMTYHRAPRWLTEGVANWVAHGGRPAEKTRPDEQARGLFPWNTLESLFMESWGDPAALDALYRQSEQIVTWLVHRFGRDRLMTFLAGIRQGKGIDRAAKMAYGMPLEDLERRWLGAVRR